jgi:acyl-CoA thioesterase I
MKRLLLICTFIFCATAVFGAEPGKPWVFNPALLKPFWLTNTMQGESVLFLKDDAAGEPKASLLFTPTKIVSVCSSSGDVTYTEGRDYVWKPSTKEITLPAESRIPSHTAPDLRRPAGSQAYRLTHRDGNGEILFGGGHEYHDMQTVVTYEHQPAAWAGPVPSFAGDQLPRTLKLLRDKQPVTIALLGDSISTGCNASGWANVAPFQPPYQDLFAVNLESIYGAKVAVKNFAVGGTGTQWGLSTIDKVIEAKPDLVILAFGMNDAAGVPVPQYQANIKGMIDAVHKALPQTEVILVATMLGNRDWTILQNGPFEQFRDALAQLCGPGIALADMTSIWAELFKHKKDWDMTGNGVNHPNDFGHRVYAQVLSTLLIDQPK